MRRKIPAGKFEPLWGKEQLRDPPPLPEKHTYKDELAYRQMEDTIQRRKDLNRQTVEARNAWWRTSNSQYFQVLTDSMLRTAPGMREILVERYAMGDGFYDGCGAMDYITEWFNTCPQGTIGVPVSIYC